MLGLLRIFRWLSQRVSPYEPPPSPPSFFVSMTQLGESEQASKAFQLERIPQRSYVLGHSCPSVQAARVSSLLRPASPLLQVGSAVRHDQTQRDHPVSHARSFEEKSLVFRSSLLGAPRLITAPMLSDPLPLFELCLGCFRLKHGASDVATMKVSEKCGFSTFSGVRDLYGKLVTEVIPRVHRLLRRLNSQRVFR